MSNLLKQYVWIALVSATAFAFGGALQAAEKKVTAGPGLVKEKPTSGRFVETPHGFMVPYTAEIPGTGIKIEMVPVPGGTFKMGSSDEEQKKFTTDDYTPKGEGPQVEVQVDPFWIGKYEMTWDQFDPFLSVYEILNEKTPEPVPAEKQADAVSYPTPIYPQEAIPIINALGRKGGYPVASMHQFCAKQYTKWISKLSGSVYRLPSGAEWEYAARAGTTTAYHFGDDKTQLKDYAWYFDNSEWKDDPERGHPDFGAGYRKVGQKKPNPWGLYDMYGNVAEWVLDEHDVEHYAKLAGKTVPWSQAINWPDVRYPRELRGGCWDSDASACRSAARWGSLKEWCERDPQIPRSVWFMTEFYNGFRVMRPLHEPDDAMKTKFWEADIDHIREILKYDKQRRSLPMKPE